MRQAASSARAAGICERVAAHLGQSLGRDTELEAGCDSSCDDGRRAESGVSGGEDAGHDLATHGGEIDPALAGDHG